MRASVFVDGLFIGSADRFYLDDRLLSFNACLQILSLDGNIQILGFCCFRNQEGDGYLVIALAPNVGVGLKLFVVICHLCYPGFFSQFSRCNGEE